jgi:hypothetical protein
MSQKLVLPCCKLQYTAFCHSRLSPRRDSGDHSRLRTSLNHKRNIHARQKLPNSELPHWMMRTVVSAIGQIGHILIPMDLAVLNNQDLILSGVLDTQDLILYESERVPILLEDL